MRIRQTISVALLLLGFGSAFGQDRERLADPKDTRVESVYKNIQILQGTPASEVVSIMKGFTRDLGVRCEFCHVTATVSDIPGFYAWSNDDVAAKKTAREMMRMIREIGRQYFPGSKGPTCWTCHRGSAKPQLEKTP